ncbi:MAG: xanthine dehydrogenase family protein molybdopterin-binding subunit [Desulfobacterales bacterium]|nr:xanthine dehydrogenase family protein molybdopterin-binding subunit [Desulfobacterales bacterium]
MYYTEGLPVPETPSPGETPGPWERTDVVGKPRPRVDAYERVSGTAVYPSDIVLPRMLYGAILRCPHPHAQVKKVDTTAAEALPGVRAVIGPGDPKTDLPWSFRDVKTTLFPKTCRFEGEPVAAVAAETLYQAWDAAGAVRVDYKVLPHVSDERRALEKDAPKVHENGNKLKTDTYSRGDVEKGFFEADVVLEQHYRTEAEVHTPLELHGCVANWDGDVLTIWESTQGVYAVQSRVAEVLGLPLSKVRVIGHYMGGGFGSKLQTSRYSIVAALLAKKTGRPVKSFLPREATFLAMGNRPPSNMTLKAGVKKDGTLTALSFTCLGTGGAYPAGGTSLVDWQIRDLYLCPHVRTECTDVYINAGPARPFRAPGHPQCSWALEQMLDALAEAIGMDPVALRLKNVPDYSQGREGNPPYTTTGLKQCFKEGARRFGWEKARRKTAGQEKKGHLRRGVGMAGSVWFVGGGGPPSTVILKLFSDGSANLNMGASDIGTGTKTVMAMVAAEELGLRPEMIRIEHADTGTTQYATPSGGSKTVPTEAPTVRDAAVQVKRRLLQMAAEEMDLPVEDLRYTGDDIVSRSRPDRRIRIVDISGLKRQGVVVGVGHRGPNPEKKTVNPFCAQFCEVEVNTRTGELRILRFLSTNESGRVMNRLTFDSQVIGGVTMGIGLAATEMRILDANRTGKMVNRNWHDYKLPTSLDVPADIVGVPIEMPDAEANISGAKGLGEPVTIPTAAAVANAVYDAVGIRITESPINPLKLSSLLEQQKKEG